ncbi:hypothetical protein [Thermococcus sp. Bubb.Bath]|uniref:hypothetical protein n=1 Tax=Thermococcus sp. Bubb.Bath TaxID=1638242 RepID=UPI00143AE7A4|nr:hypothetical protein [Thermococcus sp. Bubb.Bath]NJF25493.1 hypothetical protein [Thermococcus sp. Bubb.Bath]
MKKILFVLVSLLILDGGVMGASIPQGAPYWVKPGAFLEYKAQSYHPVGGGFYVDRNGTLIGISGPNVTVLFRITEVKKNNARVHVSITVTTKNSTFPVIVTYPNNATVHPFWSNGSVINITRTPNNITKVFLRSLIVGGDYLINLTNGWVYDFSGKAYGHTVLWNGFKENETFAIYKGKKVRIREVKVINATMNTYYSAFQKPNVIVHSEPVLVGNGRTFFDSFYNPGYDVCISFMMDPIPDFNAVGVYGFMWSDDMAASINEKLMKGQQGVPNVVWAPGVMLANASLGEPAETKASPPTGSGMKYIPLLALAVVAGAVLMWYRR